MKLITSLIFSYCLLVSGTCYALPNEINDHCPAPSSLVTETGILKIQVVDSTKLLWINTDINKPKTITAPLKFSLAYVRAVTNPTHYPLYCIYQDSKQEKFAFQSFNFQASFVLGTKFMPIQTPPSFMCNASLIDCSFTWHSLSD